MEIPSQNAPEILREEILAEARREGDEIIRRAQQEADAILARAAGEADQARQERLESARAEAARRRDLILATVPVEAGRLRSARIEALLESVRDEARRRLAAGNGFNGRETLPALAAEAIQRMSGKTFAVKVSSAGGFSSAAELAGEIAARVGRQPLNVTIAIEKLGGGDGPVIEDLEGRQVWDNRLLVRLERFWPELRRQLAVNTSLVTPSESSGGGR